MPSGGMFESIHPRPSSLWNQITAKPGGVKSSHLFVRPFVDMLQKLLNPSASEISQPKANQALVVKEYLQNDLLWKNAAT